MPRCNVDQPLLDKVNSLVTSCNGNVAAAADRIGVHRLKLWRFRASGRAIGRTRIEIATGLERLVQASVQSATGNEREIETSMPSALIRGPKAQWQPSDMRLLKHLCALVISLVDQHEASGSSPAASGTAGTAKA